MGEWITGMILDLRKPKQHPFLSPFKASQYWTLYCQTFPPGKPGFAYVLSRQMHIQPRERIGIKWQIGGDWDTERERAVQNWRRGQEIEMQKRLTNGWRDDENREHWGEILIRHVRSSFHLSVEIIKCIWSGEMPAPVLPTFWNSFIILLILFLLDQSSVISLHPGQLWFLSAMISLQARHRIDLTHQSISCEITDHHSIVKGLDEVTNPVTLDLAPTTSWSGLA